MAGMCGAAAAAHCRCLAAPAAHPLRCHRVRSEACRAARRGRSTGSEALRCRCHASPPPPQRMPAGPTEKGSRAPEASRHCYHLRSERSAACGRRATGFALGARRRRG
eukprot:3069604-Prymnesium_polylepis.1